jgi:beta-phosphoglucomutase-like phosphatase (HAD superfamily)
MTTHDLELYGGLEGRQVGRLLRRTSRRQYDPRATSGRETRPDTFLVAAKLLGVEPARAIVIEDAISGVQAGVNGNFGVIGVARKGNAEDNMARIWC